ncbi:MAG: GNAT family N-acetyltransferase [Clostridia bacterium]|nr:GNAT family N-acetyltransferase [Clostridia bacterium]
MSKLERGCRALYEQAFGVSGAFDDALFALAMPTCLRVIAQDGKPRSMLFSIPYDIVTENGITDARYMYAVATDPACRGQGLATKLLRTVIAEGLPVFLRPSAPSLFDFYRAVGLVPVSPVKTERGMAGGAGVALPLTALSPSAYLAARRAYLQPPFAAPTEAFLSLGYLGGGALEMAGQFVTFYELRGREVLFKEWLGATHFAPRVAAFLGADTYELRTPCAEGTPFGVAANCPENLTFLIALD